MFASFLFKKLKMKKNKIMQDFKEQKIIQCKTGKLANFKAPLDVYKTPNHNASMGCDSQISKQFLENKL